MNNKKCSKSIWTIARLIESGFPFILREIGYKERRHVYVDSKEKTSRMNIKDFELLWEKGFSAPIVAQKYLLRHNNNKKSNVIF